MSILRFGLSLATVASLLACQDESPSALLAGRDIKSYENTDGVYTVVCKSGLVETVTEAEIIANQVCKKGNLMQVSGRIFVMSADGTTDNCIIDATPEVTRTIYLDAAPTAVGEDKGIQVGTSPWPANMFCGVTEGIILKADLGSVKFGFSDGSKVTWED